MTCQETELSAVYGANDRERLLVVLCHAEAGSHLELRQQSWSDGLGWFTQSTVRLEPHQVASLRGALGSGMKQAAPAPAARSFTRVPPSSFLRVVHADSA